MFINKEELLSKRLRNTLTEFRTYCKKLSQNKEKDMFTRALNATVTQYRSKRELQKQPSNGKSKLKIQKKVISPENVKKTEPMKLKEDDLIQLTKVKLSSNKFVSSNRLKTEYVSRNQMRNPNIRHKRSMQINYAHGSKGSSYVKGKKLSFIVKNIQQTSNRMHERRRTMTNEISVVFKRPVSAFSKAPFHNDSLVKAKQTIFPKKHKSRQQNGIQLGGWQTQQKEEFFDF